MKNHGVIKRRQNELCSILLFLANKNQSRFLTVEIIGIARSAFFSISLAPHRQPVV